MYEPHQDTSNEKHTFPEPNTYDYASQLMFDANAFATISNQVDLNPAYLDFFQQSADPYEMFRYQTAMQQSHDYASSCSSNTPPSSYNQQVQAQVIRIANSSHKSNILSLVLPTTAASLSNDGIP